MLKQASVFLVFAIAAGIVGALGWLAWEVGSRLLATLDALPWLFPAGVVVLFVATSAVVIGAAVALVRWLNLRSRAVHPDATGLYPVLFDRAGYVNPNSEHAQALAVMHAAGRATASSVGRVLDWQPALPEPAPVPALPAPALTPSEVVDVDPRTSPHWLLIGATGSGKTVASYRILDELCKRNPAQFVITEPGGVNWASQATATDTLSIASAIGDVHGELVRRQDLLRQADVDHVRDLVPPLPYLVLVAEETETVLDDLKLQNRDLRTSTIIALRSIARLGRKCGICLVAVTQSGTTDVFDSHVRRNLGNVLLFRSDHGMAEMWRLPGVRLQDLPPGAAYSVRHSAVVNFPLTVRPQLSQPVQPAVETAGTTGGTTGGIPVPGWPVYTGIPLESIPVPAEIGSSTGIPVFGTDDNGPFTQAQAAHIMRLYGSIGTIKGVQRAIYPDLEPGGAKWYALREVIEGRAK